jgi:hypothetical protein
MLVLPIIVNVDNAECSAKVFAHLRTIERLDRMFIQITVHYFNCSSIMMKFWYTDNDFYKQIEIYSRGDIRMISIYLDCRPN